jgi:oligosaccharide repeat unit polymerase
MMRFTFKTCTRVLGILLLVYAISSRLSDGSTPIEGVALLVLTSLLAGANYRLTNDVLYPGFLISTVWALAAFVYVFCPLALDAISWKTVIICSGSLWFFSMGCFLGTRVRFDRASAGSNNLLRRTNSVAIFLLILYSLATVPLFMRDTARLANTPFELSPQFFIEARGAVVESLVDETRAYSSVVVSSAPLLAIFTCFVTLIEEKSRLLRALSVSIAVFLAILTTGRVALLLLFCGWFLIALIGKSDRRMTAIGRRLTYTGLAVILALTSVSLLTKAETQSDSGDQLTLATQLSIAYIAGPIAAFDHLVRHESVFQEQQNNTFADLFAPASRTFGLGYQSPPTVEPWVTVPIPVNVYTSFKPYYHDFGVLGCFFAFGFIGCMHGALFRAANHGSRAALFFLAGISYALIFSPFTDAYHHIFHYVYLSGYACLYFVFLKRLPDLRFRVIRERKMLPNSMFRKN